MPGLPHRDRTETAAEHFTYGELEENDEDLTKLRRWLAKIIERDVIASRESGHHREHSEQSDQHVAEVGVEPAVLHSLRSTHQQQQRSAQRAV